MKTSSPQISAPAAAPFQSIHHTSSDNVRGFLSAMRQGNAQRQQEVLIVVLCRLLVVVLTRLAANLTAAHYVQAMLQALRQPRLQAARSLHLLSPTPTALKSLLSCCPRSSVQPLADTSATLSISHHLQHPQIPGVLRPMMMKTIYPSMRTGVSVTATTPTLSTMGAPSPLTISP